MTLVLMYFKITTSNKCYSKELRQKSPTLGSIMARRKIELAKQFFTETTIHGCRYTVDRQFHICENIIWIFVTIFFFHIGAFLVYVSIVFKR